MYFTEICASKHGARNVPLAPLGLAGLCFVWFVLTDTDHIMRATFWPQRNWSMSCACAFAASYIFVCDWLNNGFFWAYAVRTTMQHAHPHKAGTGCVEAKKATLSSKAIGLHVLSCSGAVFAHVYMYCICINCWKVVMFVNTHSQSYCIKCNSWSWQHHLWLSAQRRAYCRWSMPK